jgi:hypothetical protein
MHDVGPGIREALQPVVAQRPASNPYAMMSAAAAKRKQVLAEVTPKRQEAQRKLNEIPQKKGRPTKEVKKRKDALDAEIQFYNRCITNK